MGSSPYFFRFILLFLFLFCGFGCSMLATRPVLEMAQTGSALRAAKEVQADTLSPEYFRQAKEWFFRARHEYQFKNFKLAKEYADRARYFAEHAEYDSVRNGGSRAAQVPSDSQPPPDLIGGGGGGNDPQSSGDIPPDASGHGRGPSEPMRANTPTRDSLNSLKP